MTELRQLERRIFGLKVTPCGTAELLDQITRSIKTRERTIIASLNLHGIYMHQRCGALRALHEDPRTIVHVDGISVIWLARLQGHRIATSRRTAWIDWLPSLLALAEKHRWRIFHLGGSEAVLRAGLARLREEHPGLVIDGRPGFFEAWNDAAVLDEVNRFAPDFLIVGMGMGRQESWIVEYFDRLDVPCIATAGACLEYFAGEAPMPPRVLGLLGLEWFYRLLTNPRRFAWRYLGEPWFAIYALMLAHFRSSCGAGHPLAVADETRAQAKEDVLG